MQEEFGRDEFGLEDILPDGRLAICEMIFSDLLEGFTDEFARLYEEYNRVVEMLQASGFEPPPQFRQLTEFTLGRRFEREIARQQQSRDPARIQGSDRDRESGHEAWLSNRQDARQREFRAR